MTDNSSNDTLTLSCHKSCCGDGGDGESATDCDELKFITFNLTEPMVNDEEQYPMAQRDNLKLDMRIQRIKKISLLWIGTNHVICYQGLDDEWNTILTNFFCNNKYCFNSEYCEGTKLGIGIAYPPTTGSPGDEIFKCKDLIKPMYKRLYDSILSSLKN